MSGNKTHKIPDFSAKEAQPFFLQGGDTGVLLIHGFTGCVSHWRPIGERLHAAGYTVRGISLLGHGESLEAMAKTTWKDWLGGARKELAELRKSCSQVVTAGLSMGGDIALILASEGDVAACIPVSAPTAVKNKMLPFTGLVSLVTPTIWWRSDPTRASVVDKTYDYGYPGFPARKGMDMYKMLKLVNAALPKITCPVLVVQSHADETIAPESADTIMKGVSSSHQEVLWLEEVPHVCTISKEMEHIAQRMIQFLQARVGAGTP